MYFELFSSVPPFVYNSMPQFLVAIIQSYHCFHARVDPDLVLCDWLLCPLISPTLNFVL